MHFSFYCVAPITLCNERVSEWELIITSSVQFLKMVVDYILFVSSLVKNERKNITTGDFWHKCAQ